ncbi:MAG: hypothetical protein JWQ46_3078 [Phenylobacterium sp.]|nr:hypothetical protein [Phenylobacterium sp.]
MDTQSATGGQEQGTGGEHQGHEQRLAAGLRELVHQVDISDYRDALGHPMRNNLAFLKAQAVVDAFGISHEQLCKTLDDCDLSGDLTDAARKIFELRQAKPGESPPGYRTWQTGP